MDSINFVLMQTDIAFGEPKINRQHIAALFAQAKLQPKEIVVLPELWNTAYDLTRLAEIADVDGKDTLIFLKELACQYQVSIVGGSVTCRYGERYYNTTFVVNELGELAAQYDKVHLFRLMNEEKYLTAGSHLTSFQLNGCPVGLGICYDLRFPELFRSLAVKGAKVFVIPAQWPKPRIEHWCKLVQARAIENQAFVVAVNRVGEDAQNYFNGHSLAVDPLGNILLELEEDEAVQRVKLDLTMADQVRKEIPIFEDRRPELYD